MSTDTAGPFAAPNPRSSLRNSFLVPGDGWMKLLLSGCYETRRSHDSGATPRHRPTPPTAIQPADPAGMRMHRRPEGAFACLQRLSCGGAGRSENRSYCMTKKELVSFCQNYRSTIMTCI